MYFFLLLSIFFTSCFLGIGFFISIMQKPIILSAKWMFVFLALCTAPGLFSFLLVGDTLFGSLDLYWLKLVFPFFIILITIYSWPQYHGYMIFGIDEGSFRKEIISILEDMNLKWEEQISTLRIPSENLEIQIAFQGWSGVGQIRKKNKNSSATFKKIISKFKSSLSKKDIKVHNYIGVQFLILGIFFALISSSFGISRFNSSISDIYCQLNSHEVGNALRKAEEVKEKFGDESAKYATALYRLAGKYSGQLCRERAIVYYRKSRNIYEKVYGKDHKYIAAPIYKLANLNKYKERYKKSEELYRQALVIYTNGYGPDHWHVAKTLNSFANLYQYKKDYKEAENLYKRSISIYAKQSSPKSTHFGVTLKNLAELYIEQGQYSKAEQYLERALGTFDTRTFVKSVRQKLTKLKCIRKRFQDAYEIRKQHGLNVSQWSFMASCYLFSIKNSLFG